MLGFTRAKEVVATCCFSLVGLGGAYFYGITPPHSFAPPESAQGLLDRADVLSWGNRWAEAKPLYEQAATKFTQQGETSKALYAAVSEIPVDETVSASTYILRLTNDLKTPEAQDRETRLRILTVLGLVETNYNAALALPTWQKVQRLALERGHLMLASRSQGEQGIATYILGDKATGAKLTIRAWTLAKAEHDTAATVRYASLYGAGQVDMQEYKKALKPLDEALRLAQETPSVAYPTIAVDAKIEALGGLHRYNEALQLSNVALQRLQGTLFDGEKTEVYLDRAEIERGQGNLTAAAADCERSLAISRRIAYYRGVANAAGRLALTYEQADRLPEALAAINAAIEANTHIPLELYLVPRNLATKADIESRLGKTRDADDDYRKAIALVNDMIRHAPALSVQRQLLADMSNVYSGYFASLCAQRRYDEALQILDNVRGRLEVEALQHHAYQQLHEQTLEEKELTRLNVLLINTDDPSTRTKISNAIYTAELSLTPDTLAQQTITHPVHLPELQHSLGPKTLVIEYVLAEPNSYAFAITHASVRAYRLPAKAMIEADATKYREEIRSKLEDKPLAQKLFSELLLPIPEYAGKTDLVVIPDGSLHLLPFTALVDGGGYVSISRASDDARVYTNNAETLGERLATDITKTAAVDFRPPSPTEQAREAVQAFRANEPGKATDILQEQGRVYEYANPDSRLAAVAIDYAARPDRTVIVAPDAADRQELTQLIRADLQAQGRIAEESRSIPTLVEQDFSNKKLAANYQPGDEIHYKTGSPTAEGIPNNSAATVLSVDGNKNILTVETREGEQVSYNPAQLRRQTAESTIYREESRELAEGDRISFTTADRENRVRSGDFANVERIGDDNSISARLDSGRAVELDPEKARHIDYGYTVESAQHLSADRLILTGESSQLAGQQEALTRLNPHTREVGIYTSDGSNPLQQAQGIATDVQLTEESFSIDSALSNSPEPTLPQIDFEGFGLGL